MKYDNAVCNQFVTDMEQAGFDVEHYHGRFFWEGPAVRCEREDEQDVIRATKVRLQSDSMGLGTIFYPVRSGKLLNEEAENELENRIVSSRNKSFEDD